MKKHYFRTALLTCLALVMVLGASVGESLSYFTTYVTAQGGHTIYLRNVNVWVDETVDGNTKQIVMRNTGEEECFVRVRVICGSLVELDFANTEAGWYDGGDGYWYYSDPLPVGGASTTLRTAITFKGGTDRDYNVIVIGEATPVLYDQNGNAYADWTKKARVD